MSTRHPFGWNYPAGAENDPRAPWNQVDEKCEECGLVLDDCTCVVCEECGEINNPDCYKTHFQPPAEK
jgi:hypothetical protein